VNYSVVTGKQPFTVLVVEDEALLRWAIAELLRRCGHSVIEATSADKARDAMGQTAEPIDVVLLDFRLPDSNDLRLLEEVRRRSPQSAVVLMTACDTPELVQGALERGAYCVLNKPFDLHDVEGLITDAYRASRIH
jgi:DNA-binding NtrC family response regulator